ncbi:MAG: hypothetical protein ACOCM4_13360, partial [Acetivibrio ethanolgignens]
MIQLLEHGAYVLEGREIIEESPAARERLLTRFGGEDIAKEEAKKGTMAYRILAEHNTSGDME